MGSEILIRDRFPVTIHSWVDDMTSREHGQHQGSVESERVVEAMVVAGTVVATCVKAKRVPSEHRQIRDPGL